MYQHFCKTNKTKVDTTLMYFSMSSPYGCLVFILVDFNTSFREYFSTDAGQLSDRNLLQNRISKCRTEGLLCTPAHFVKTEILLH